MYLYLSLLSVNKKNDLRTGHVTVYSISQKISRVSRRTSYNVHVLIPEALYFITIQTEVHAFVDIVLNIHRHQRLNVAKIPPVKSRDNPRASRERIDSIDQPTRGKSSMEQCSQSYPLSPRSSQLPDVDESQPKMSSTQPVQNVSSVVENLSSEPLAPHISTKPSSCDGGKFNFVSNPLQQLSICTSNVLQNLLFSLVLC